MNIQVKSVVINWPEKTVDITSTDGGSHTLPLNKEITVTMIGYPDRIEETMLALSLAAYISQGYIIEQISFEESNEGDEYHYPAQRSTSQMLHESGEDPHLFLDSDTELP
jgi:hypothetical protein